MHGGRWMIRGLFFNCVLVETPTHCSLCHRLVLLTSSRSSWTFDMLRFIMSKRKKGETCSSKSPFASAVHQKILLIESQHKVPVIEFLTSVTSHITGRYGCFLVMHSYEWYNCSNTGACFHSPTLESQNATEIVKERHLNNSKAFETHDPSNGLVMAFFS